MWITFLILWINWSVMEDIRTISNFVGGICNKNKSYSEKNWAINWI